MLRRALLPALLPTLLWHAAAQAQLLGVDPAGGGGGLGAGPVSGAGPVTGGTLGTVGAGLLGTPSGRSFRITPRVALTETLTSNATLTATDPRADLITQVTAGVQMASTGGRLRGFVDYALTGVHYARGSAGFNTQNNLRAALTAEVLERRGFIDVDANVSQRSVSAFGTQSSDPALANANRTEVRTYRVSPYLRGAIADAATYEARLTRTGSNVAASNVSNVSTSTASLLLGGAGGGARKFNWSADASRQVVDFSSGTRRESDRLNGVLIYIPVPELRLSLIGGREANNFASVDKTSRNVYGARLNWIPSPRTSAVAEAQRRFFGNSHVLSLSHRMARSAVLVSDTRDVVVSGTQADGGVRATVFDLYFLQFSRIEPDAVLRAALVNDFLRANGLDPQALLPFSLVTSAISLQRLQQLSFTWFGLRDTLTLVGTRTNTQRLANSVTSGAGDLSTFSGIRQQSVAATLTHRLTPISNLTATLLQTQSAGDSTTATVQSTRLRSANLSWSMRINPRAAATLSARHQRFDSTTGSYNESALIANLNLTF